MTQAESMFQFYIPKNDTNENIVFGDNSRGDVLGVGKIAITLDNSLSNVLHVDSLSFNLLSVSQLCEIGYNCLFTCNTPGVSWPRNALTLQEIWASMTTSR
jgi:hypothetical protein